jgi:hypothetical protein
MAAPAMSRLLSGEAGVRVRHASRVAGADQCPAALCSVLFPHNWSAPMAETGRLELDIVDVQGTRLTEPVTVSLRHRTFQEQRLAEKVDAAHTIAIAGLRREPQGLYTLEVTAKSYRPVQRFVTIPASGVKRETVMLPIRDDRARAVFPPFDDLDDRVKGVLERSGNVAGHEGQRGRELYVALSDEARAGLLNISKKSLATEFRNGGDLLPHLVLLDIRGDRCFVEVPRSLIDQMPQLVDGDSFRPVNGSLHQAPAGFVPVGSFKTDDAFGNLQLTFFRSGDRCRADVDIDDAAGLGHVFQVARNHVTGNPTHPYNIHEILMAHQHLDPGYRLVPA